MVNLHASFFHHLLELAVADRIRHLPTHAPEDDLSLKMIAFEIDHREALRCQTDHDHIPTDGMDGPNGISVPQYGS